MWIDGLEVGQRKIVEQAEVKGLDFPIRFEGTWLSGSNADEKEDVLLFIMDIEASRLALDRFT